MEVPVNLAGTPRPPFETEKITTMGYYPTYLGIASELGMWARVCEIGVDRGGSLRMWQALFPFGDVAGVDSNPAATWPDGTTRIVRDQADPGLPGLVGQRDLIVDDASHEGQLTRATFNLLWPSIVPGGYYVIEDWWSGYHQDQSMFRMAEGLLPLVGAPDNGTDADSITLRYGLIIVHKRAGPRLSPVPWSQEMPGVG